MSDVMQVAQVGLWWPGCADAASWVAGSHDPAQTQARAEILPPMIRRRASALTRAAADAYAQATALVDRSQLATVLGSAWGETSALAELLDQLQTPEGELSPTRFAGSVHNAASGHLSIVTGLRGFATSIAAGTATPAMALLEASCLLRAGHPAAVVVVGDVAPPADLTPLACATAAVALLLLPVPAGALALPALARIGGLRREPAPAGSGHPSPAVPPEVAANPCGGAAQLLSAILGGRTGRVSLQAGELEPWSIEVLAPSPVADDPQSAQELR